MRQVTLPLVSLLMSLLLGCVRTTVTEPEFWVPPGAVEYAPPPIYGIWRDQVAQASGIESWPLNVTWWRVPGAGWMDPGTGGGHTVGLRAPDNRIFIASGYTDNEGLVKHEMLHVFLDGDPHHVHWLFQIYHAACWRNCFPG